MPYFLSMIFSSSFRRMNCCKERKLIVHSSSALGFSSSPPFAERMNKVESSARALRWSVTIDIFFSNSSSLRWIPFILTSGISSSSEEYPILRPSFFNFEVPFVCTDCEVLVGSTKSTKICDIEMSGSAMAISDVIISISGIRCELEGCSTHYFLRF